jgi:flavin-dependent dehydrogenase
MVKTKVDIIGGSIAGLATAITIKKLNKKIDVNIYEKHKKIGYSPEGRRCGEGYFTEGKWKKFKPLETSIFNHIYRVETILENKKYIMEKKTGNSYMLNRPEYIAQLGREAEKIGANIFTNHKVKTIKELDGDFIIDASGCPSFAKRELKIKQNIIGKTYQQTLENTNFFYKNTLKVFFTEKIGYIWVFPRNPDKKEINLGIGVIGHKTKNLKQILNNFKEKNKIRGDINYTTGGLIPVGMQKPLKYENILFVGDTGAGTLPHTGEGIYRALLSGDLAAKCIVKNQINKYPYEIYRYFIKWDIIGKLVIRSSSMLENVGSEAVNAIHRLYLDLWYSFFQK